MKQETIQERVLQFKQVTNHPENREEREERRKRSTVLKNEEEGSEEDHDNWEESAHSHRATLTNTDREMHGYACRHITLSALSAE